MSAESFSPHSTVNDSQPPVLFLFLGASNLARSYCGLKSCITRCLSPRSVSFIHALGPGRGYIREGGIFNVVYPPILNCGIFEGVPGRGDQQVVALITDIGNDIMYGVPAKEIIAGLRSIFATLREAEARIFITLIPVNLQDDIDEFYFRALRRIFFPSSTVAYDQASEAVREINKFILESANENLKVIGGLEQYCGFDKIHYSLLKSCPAWSYIASNLTDSLGTTASPDMKISETAVSLASNLARIFFTDMLGIMNKTNETF